MTNEEKGLSNEDRIKWIVRAIEEGILSSKPNDDVIVVYYNNVKIMAVIANRPKVRLVHYKDGIVGPERLIELLLSSHELFDALMKKQARANHQNIYLKLGEFIDIMYKGN